MPHKDSYLISVVPSINISSPSFKYSPFSALTLNLAFLPHLHIVGISSKLSATSTNRELPVNTTDLKLVFKP